jgi:hypothetical protein
MHGEDASIIGAEGARGQSRQEGTEIGLTHSEPGIKPLEASKQRSGIT